MQRQLAIFACSHLMPELSHIFKKGSYPDVKLLGYPAHCLIAANDNHYLIDAIAKKKKSFANIIVITSSCSGKVSLKKESAKNLEIIHLDQCQELFLNKETLHYFIQQGCYVITNGWLRTYEEHIRDWGFDAPMAKAFFNESMKKILLLDTGIPGNYHHDLASLAEYMGLPYDVLPIGLSHAGMFFKGLVAEWRADQIHSTMSDKVAILARERADYLIIVNQLRVLVDLKQETQIVREVFSLLTILFAPGAICYRQFNESIETQKLYYNDKVFSSAWDGSRSFSLEVFYQGEMVGIFELAEIKFPEYIENYKRLGAIISQICSLAIANARKYEIMEQQKEQLLKSNQSKDKFFSILAHDLRSPLHALIGLTDILHENLESFSSGELQSFIQGLNKSVVNLSSLLENLLEWSSVNRGIMEFKPEKIQLLKLVRKAVTVFRDASERKSITIQNHIEDSVTAYADYKMVDSIIRNLVSNAIKFTPREGSISIASQNIPEDKVLISISDTGIGMSEELQESLFKLEAKVSRPGTEDEPSTGLGLLLSKEFVEKHGGRIWIESRENLGSTFYFTLPSG